MVAGRPHAKFDFNTPADIPVALIAGGSDPLMPPRQMLVISYRLQRAVKQREVITLDGQDHWSAGAAGIPAAICLLRQTAASEDARALSGSRSEIQAECELNLTSRS